MHGGAKRFSGERGEGKSGGVDCARSRWREGSGDETQGRIVVETEFYFLQARAWTPTMNGRSNRRASRLIRLWSV